MATFSIKHDRKACIGCGLCASVCPENWIMDSDGKAKPLKTEIDQVGNNKDAADSCPVACIRIAERK